MKTLDVSAYGVEEMNKQEMMQVEGGKIDYVEYKWSGTSNSLAYFFEACYNGGVSIVNGAIWVINLFLD
jgi:bacteriocin-like protein